MDYLDTYKQAGIESAVVWLETADIQAITLLEVIKAAQDSAPIGSAESIKFIAAFIEEVCRQVMSRVKMYGPDLIQKFHVFAEVDAIRWVTSYGQEYIKDLSDQEIREIAEKLFAIWHKSEICPDYIKKLYIEAFRKQVEVLVKYL